MRGERGEREDGNIRERGQREVWRGRRGEEE